MGWIIEFDEEAVKDLKKLSRDAHVQITSYLRKRISNASHPQDFGKPLTGDKVGLWRYRVEKYRIICKIEDAKMVVLVIRIGKRDKVYDDD